jgi:GNAT superfamily N-acetyltransferase
MQDKLIVRAAHKQDFDAWLPLWDDYNTFYGRSGPTALPMDVTLSTWSRFFDAYEPMHALVAEYDGELVGLVHFLYHRHTTIKGPTCYLQDLFTDASQRGKGIGRALIEAVYEKARADGVDRVYWQTHEANRTAMALYDQVAEKTGFVIYRKMV